MSEVEYEVRLMRKEDVPQALDIWRETGMQEGTHAPYTWMQVDPQGFYVAVTSSGEVIGVCCALTHHEDLLFVGMYAVRKKYRGLGVGYKVWKACMDHIGEKNAALNAVPGKLELYRDKGGFAVVETEWLCVINETESPVDPSVLRNDPPTGIDIIPLEDDHLPLVLEYDLKLAGYNREKAITLNCREKDSHTYLALQDGKCVGYGTIKMSVQVAGQIGPLYADDPEIAEILLRRLIETKPKIGFCMMSCSNNVAASALMRKLNVPLTEECDRCYKKYKIPVKTDKIYGQLDLNYSPF